MGRIVGIDLGTTTSEIAYIKNGKPEIIKNGYSSITPSVVGLDKNLNIIVGQPAKNQIITAKDRTVAEVKRKMGTSDNVLMAGKKFTPIEISTFILKELKRIGEDFLQEEITEAVITVPANFNDAQRQATKEAGEKAGLIVERIINEPTAAALAFGIENMQTEGKVLVYDLGGGTFDVTVFQMLEGSLDVMASRGVNRLGGKDFDDLIVNEIIQSFKQEYGYDLSQDVKAYARIKDEAEKAKISLSNVEIVSINLPYIAMIQGEPISYEMELTRSRYESLIRNMVDLSFATVQEALDAAKITAQEVDIVLAVGGSSRTPMIKRMLTERFGAGKLQGGINQDEAVALGAAVQAGIQNHEISGNDSIVIFDVCNHTLGTDVTRMVYGGKLEAGFFDRLILRDTHLPFRRTQTYCTVSDYQTTTIVGIYQGEADKVKDNIKIGEVLLEGIPANKAGEESVEVTFEYNLNGMLNVTAKVCSTGYEISTKVNMYKYDAPKSKEESNYDDLEWQNHTLADDIRTTIMIYQKKRNELPENVRQQADSIMNQLKEAVISNNAKLVEELDDKLTALLFEF